MAFKGNWRLVITHADSHQPKLSDVADGAVIPE